MVLKGIPMNINILARAAILAAILGLLAFVHGCGTNPYAQTDKTYQRILEQQIARREALDETEMILPSLNDPRIIERRGDTYLQSGNIAMACLEYDKILKENPRKIEIREKLAYLLLKQEMWGKALQEFDIILRDNPGNPRAMQGKATALIHLGRLKEAQAFISRLIESDSGLWQAHALLGTIFDRQNMHSFAVNEYEKALAINPAASGIYERLGKALYMAGNYRQSATAYLKAIDRDGPDPGRYNGLGSALFKLGLHAEALETFKKAGDEAGAYNAMGMLYLEMKDYPQSMEYFTKAIDLKPTYYVSAHKNLKAAQSAMQAEKKGW